jgi:regulatory protein
MEDFEKFYNSSLRFMSYRPRSEKEVRDKLKRKKVDPSIIEKIITKLKGQKFINDEEFAKWWIDSRLRFRPRSINLIKRELLLKGLDKELIDAQISNFQFPISNELENAKKLIQKKIKRYRNLSKQEIYQKLGRYLASKGFDWDTIKQSIDESLFNGV